MEEDDEAGLSQPVRTQVFPCQKLELFYTSLTFLGTQIAAHCRPKEAEAGLLECSDEMRYSMLRAANHTPSNFKTRQKFTF